MASLERPKRNRAARSFRQLRRYVRSSSPPPLVGTREGGPPSGSAKKALTIGAARKPTWPNIQTDANLWREHPLSDRSMRIGNTRNALYICERSALTRSE